MKNETEKKSPQIDPVLGDTISRSLRSYYQSVQEETIPDKFLDLLERLDEADQQAKQQATSK